MRNRYAAGNTVYGFGRPNPTQGPVDKSGYRERDRLYKLKKRRNAMLRRMKANQQGNFFNKDVLGGSQ